MRFNLRGWSMFGAGLLLGGVGASALFAPPELANQPAPWDRTAQESGPAAAATHAAGAGPAQPRRAAPVAVQAHAAGSAAPAVTAMQALAAASQPAAASTAPAAVQAQSAAAPAGATAASNALEQVARSEPVEMPHAATESHRKESRKAESASRHAVAPKDTEDTKDTTEPEADAQAQPEARRTAKSESRAPRTRYAARSRSDSADGHSADNHSAGEDRAADGSASGNDVVRLPPPVVPRFDTFSAPPATATGDPTAGGDPGSGDSSQ